MPRRQAMGILFAFLLIMAGRMVRHTMLLNDEGNWKESLWLDEFLMPASALASENGLKKSKPKLTTPLPINTCSLDSLQLLPGVGQVMAIRIDEARQQGLVFSSAKDLRTIKGIGEKLSARLDTLVLYGRNIQTMTETADSARFQVFPEIP
ncbi:MAG: helix-hairpin-helix domain-containing protein [bacterium]|nr:helix-hairpin-helix domain-containing protein [bacterium]